jgi:hypothetical protein
MYFIRHTENPEKDLERKTSIHCSPYTLKDVEAYGEEEVKGWIEEGVRGEPVLEIKYIEEFGVYCAILEGLCGFECESETEEDAIKEAIEHEKNVDRSNFSGNTLQKAHVFKGTYICSSLFDEGCIFSPEKLIK